MGRLTIISGDFAGSSTISLVQDGKLIVKSGGKTRVFQPEDLKAISKISAKKIAGSNTNIFNNLFRMGADLALLLGLGNFIADSAKSGFQYKLRLVSGESMIVKSGKEDYFALRNMLLDSSPKIINAGNEIVRDEPL